MTHLSVGDTAPDFALRGHLGDEMSLSSLRGSPVALVFFPLAWTPV